jgi:hypothetical protein
MRDKEVIDACTCQPKGHDGVWAQRFGGGHARRRAGAVVAGRVNVH